MSQASASSDTVPSQPMARPEFDQGWTPESGRPLAIIVLASGSGTNLQAILDRFRRSRSVNVVGVASNHAEAPALKRAAGEGIPTAVFERPKTGDRKARDREMAAWITEQGAQLVVAAGYLEILSAEFVDQFRNRIINIHPSLLPDYPGLNSIQRAYEDGASQGGVTIHFVDEGVDTGPTIKQRKIRRYRRESLERLESRVHHSEHKLLPRVVREVASGKVKIGDSVSASGVRETPGEKVTRHIRAFTRFPRLLLDFFATPGPEGHPHPTAGPGPH
jgi:phosphoribosylglycinamide formyltransferase-1